MNDEDMRTYLDVSFEEKDEAKSIGARWDPVERRWFIPTYVPPEDFEKYDQWFSEDLWYPAPLCPKEKDPFLWGNLLFADLHKWATDWKLAPASLAYWDINSGISPLEKWSDTNPVVQIVWPRGPYCWAVILTGRRSFSRWKPLIGDRRYFLVPGHHWSFSVQYVDLSDDPEEIERIKQEEAGQQ
jgi:hypothetical protein